MRVLWNIESGNITVSLVLVYTLDKIVFCYVSE
jgi:hypothetical protein